MQILITGGCGFLGSNLAKYLANKQNSIIVFDNLSRLGARENLQWLQEDQLVEFVFGDIRDQKSVEKLFEKYKPDFVLHLAGQVAMTTSIENPRLDFETNALGTLNVLEAIRKKSPSTKLIYSSTNKVYGDFQGIRFLETETRYIAEGYEDGFDEALPLEFHSPYGCSKGAADQYIQDYSRIFGLEVVVFRHSSMLGGRQFSTYDQGWVGWFVTKALEQKNGIKEPFTIAGNGKQVRDLLHADDMCMLYTTSIEQFDKIAGNCFNIGGSVDNSFSILELLNVLQKRLNTELHYKQISTRKSDQKVFIANINKINSLIGWKPEINKNEALERMIEWCTSNLNS